MKKIINKIPLLSFIFGLCLVCFIWGGASSQLKIFPHEQIIQAVATAKQFTYDLSLAKPWFYQPTNATSPLILHKPADISPGLTKIVSIDTDNTLAIKVIDINGEAVQQWNPEWFAIWKNPTHLAKKDQPKTRPGTTIHGAEILKDGSVVFNFEGRGMVRLDACGNVMWKLPFTTHHSIHITDNDTIIAPGGIIHAEDSKEYENIKGPFIEDVILEISMEGSILSQKSIIALLIENNLPGLIYTSSQSNWHTVVTDDLFHLNDIEIFPKNLEPGVFKPGDIMLSLRNLNAILVLDKNYKIKYTSIGKYIRQHDPDFINGNTISVYDNNNIGLDDQGHYSRIAIENAELGTVSTYFEGSKQQPFYAKILGKHQWLKNGNLLVNEGPQGRAFELNAAKEIVWEYNNLAGGEGFSGVLMETQRLPSHFTSELFSNARENCAI